MLTGIVAETDFFTLTEQMGGAIAQANYALRQQAGEATELPPVLMQLRRGFAESPAWFLVQAAEFRPEPLTVERLRVRDVYGSPALVAALLEIMASEKWLERRGAEYALLPAGEEILARLMRLRDEMAARVQPRLLVDLRRLADLLRRILDASLTSGDPPGVWCLAHSRRRAPDDDAPPLRQLVQYSEDFNAFRDDCHMAAYRPHGIAGHVWEAFTFIWTEQASSADALFDQLAHRGYAKEDYAAALNELAARGWIELSGGAAHMNGRGRQVRETAERLTDEYYYAPWACLTEAEILEVRDGLRALIEQASALTA